MAAVAPATAGGLWTAKENLWGRAPRLPGARKSAGSTEIRLTISVGTVGIELPLEAALPNRPPLTRSAQSDHDGIFHRHVLR